MQAFHEAAGEFEVVGCVTTVAAILTSARTGCPELILLSGDLEDGPLAGFEALREIGDIQFTGRVVMLLDDAHREAVTAAFRAGAKGIFLRDQPIAALFKCMRQVYGGQIWADATQLNYLLEALATASPVHAASAAEQLLTTREKEIAQSVAQGFSNREISRKLNLSEHTVKNYLFRIFDKLGISGRVELAMYLVHNKEIG